MIRASTAAVLAASILAIGCGSSPGASNTPVTPATYSDTFAFCTAAGTIDAPDARYTGPQYPQPVLDALARAAGHPIVTGVAPWRCMNGDLWACDIGANLPCGKINTSEIPTQAMKDYCASTPGSAFIPKYVTGHDTAYDWSCAAAQATAGRQLISVDPRWFAKEYWYRLSAPARG